jgi:hypothetical protein
MHARQAARQAARRERAAQWAWAAAGVGQMERTLRAQSPGVAASLAHTRDALWQAQRAAQAARLAALRAARAGDPGAAPAAAEAPGRSGGTSVPAGGRMGGASSANGAGGGGHGSRVPLAVLRGARSSASSDGTAAPDDCGSGSEGAAAAAGPAAGPMGSLVNGRQRAGGLKGFSDVDDAVASPLDGSVTSIAHPGGPAAAPGHGRGRGPGCSAALPAGRSGSMRAVRALQMYARSSIAMHGTWGWKARAVSRRGHVVERRQAGLVRTQRA